MENKTEEFNIRVGYISDATLKLAETELRETPEIREAAIKELRKLLHASPDLNYRDDDEFLVVFLRACHFYPESALKKMKSIASFRKDYAHLVRGLQLEPFKEKFMHGNTINVLKNCDQLGRRVMLINSGGAWDPAFVSSDETFQLLYGAHLVAQLEPESQVRGVVCILDFEGLSFKQLKALTPNYLLRLLSFIQDAFPLRLKEVHVVKQPYIFKALWSLAKPMIQEKLRNRINFHGDDMKSLHKFIEPDYLPRDFGGYLPTIDYGGKEWYEAVEIHKDYIGEWAELGPAKW
ncbi:clavesin-1-like [Episyrphus balteatus]|uniref:clavesin-1-like n=1 Tax=Episyrphus balteatus TaxID=286459 RepID=UPI0024867DC1|nr:clavesin-1-like [Episyrphus balteatus]